MADIFLSYKRTDRDRVAPIVALLRARGWSVWWDERIDAGEQWDEVIEREVNAARCVVAVWSFQSVNSRWVRTEASEGLERGILVPVLIDATKPPLEFKRVQAIDLTGWRGEVEERCAKMLVSAVARFLGQIPADGGDLSPAAQTDPRGRGPQASQWEQRRRELVERLRHWGRLAAVQVERCAAAARAAVEPLIWRAKRVKGAILLSALVVALILTAAYVPWPGRWFDAEPQLVEDVLAVGERRIANRDIRGARRILTAYEGVAPGRITLALGETYDPNMLAALGTEGVPADPEKAKKLYGKALDLGVPGAKRRLDGLNLPELPAPKEVASGLRIAIARVVRVLRPDVQAGFRIEVIPRHALPGNAFVRIRGLPRSVSLTEGHSIAPGAWAVPIFGLAALEVIAPVGVSGRAEVRISLVAVDGAVLAEAMTNLEVVDPLAQRKRPVVTPGPLLTRDPLPSPPPFSAEQKERAERLLAKGRQQWESGNVAGARSLFERAFEEGLAAAAIDMAKTYDRAELALIEVLGVRPEPGAAVEWYHRALKNGVLKAREPLTRLCRQINPGGVREACRPFLM